jgi:oxygen-independent coproporphyrinogen-3 oxidase
VASGQITAPDEDVAAELYEIALMRLADAGYRHYEVSNWARLTPAENDDNAAGTPVFACRHNLLYWRNQEYLGIGPGAHSHLLATCGEDERPLGRRWGNRKPVPSYVKRINGGQPVEESSEIIDQPLAMGETMMLGLRLRQEGVAFDRFLARHGQDLRRCFAGQLSELQGLGLLVIDDERVRLTDRGIMLGNQVFARFLPA